ncbi:hypothetical protein [Treponema sp.]|uniref:hypothetical protein n=1 Tax=Treponema sp. TaxID=166 RepID=UPI00298E3251|nr:hypothetical protein [Treponema sp.]MCR5612506.1 hypothetical protein [Treponema sp.]
MNKKFLMIPVLMLSCFLTFAKDRGFFGFQFGLGGTVPLYGDGIQWDNHSKMNDEKYARVIFGADAGITLRLSKPLYFICGIDTSFDFTWNKDYYLNSIDYAFIGGFQFYPGWGNLSFTLAYAFGSRSDFVKLSPGYPNVTPVKWGNGFKIAVEYDFIDGGGIVPVAGVYYRFMPRGYDKYDNILSIYFRLAFR